MPTVTVPASFGALREFNPYHDEHGRFSTSTRARGTSVGITSARPGKQNAQVFRDMRAFEGTLKGLPGVRGVVVKPGLGAWEGGSEPTWVVRYKGNGAAKRLLARTGARFDQDAVLTMKDCRGPRCDPAVDLTFDTAVSMSQREGIHRTLVKHGIGGWTWLKSGGRTTLRMVSVPAWGGNRRKHLKATKAISTFLTEEQYGHRRSVRGVKAEVLERATYAKAS